MKDESVTTTVISRGGRFIMDVPPLSFDEIACAKFGISSTLVKLALSRKWIQIHQEEVDRREAEADRFIQQACDDYCNAIEDKS
jgi:hypothetical protein